MTEILRDSSSGLGNRLAIREVCPKQGSHPGYRFERRRKSFFEIEIETETEEKSDIQMETQRQPVVMTVLSSNPAHYVAIWS